MLKRSLIGLFLTALLLVSAVPAFAQVTIQVTNAGSTGTTVGSLAKLSAAPSTALITATTDVSGIVGVVIGETATATTGNAVIAVSGIASCTFDAGGVTAGHYVINSTVTAGDCRDGGTSKPIASQPVGIALATVASGAANIVVIPTDQTTPPFTVGTSTISGGTAPCLVENSASTTSACAGVGTGVVTALGVNTGSAGAFVVNGGALGTPSSGTGTNLTGIPNAGVLGVTTGSGTTHTMGNSGPREYWFCTTTCTVTMPVPAAGQEFCVINNMGVSTAITLAAIGSSALYPKTDSSGYGTAGTGTMVSTAASANKICLIGLDATHYNLGSFVGSWTTN